VSGDEIIPILSELEDRNGIYDQVKKTGMIERVFKVMSSWGDSVSAEVIQGVLDALLEEAEKPLPKSNSNELH